MRRRLYEAYRHILPEISDPGVGDIGQGFTPLVQSRSIGPSIGLAELWFKLESLNPTGSYKDRFAGLAVNLALANRARGCVATSSGNTGAALAAAGAAFGLPCSLFVSERAPAGKLVQMQAYGAKVYRVRGFGVDSEESRKVSAALGELSTALRMPFVVSAYRHCPEAMEGIKTIAHEIFEEIGTPDHVFAPAGGGGLFAAVGRGFEELEQAGSPCMNVVQPRLNDTIVTPLMEGRDEGRSVSTATRISGLAVARDLDAARCISIARRSGGVGVLVDDEDAFDVQRRLAWEEGILVEPAGAVAVAGAIAAFRSGQIAGKGRVVCLLTGHGFKDPASMEGLSEATSPQLISRTDFKDVLR